MKITDLKVFVVNQFVYVKIETDEGIYGVGEASLSGRSLAVVGALEHHLKPLLMGQDATRIEHIWQDIFRGTFWRGGPCTAIRPCGNRHRTVGLGRKGARRADLSAAWWRNTRQGSGLSPCRSRRFKADGG